MVFLHGLYVKGKWIPEPTVYAYGVFQVSYPGSNPCRLSFYHIIFLPLPPNHHHHHQMHTKKISIGNGGRDTYNKWYAVSVFPIKVFTHLGCFGAHSSDKLLLPVRLCILFLLRAHDTCAKRVRLDLYLAYGICFTYLLSRLQSSFR